MPKMINIHEAKTHFSKLLARVCSGEEIIIAKSGRPIALIVPIEKKLQDRSPESAKNKIFIAEDFDAPLPDDILYEFEK